MRESQVRLFNSRLLSVFKIVFLVSDFSLMALLLVLQERSIFWNCPWSQFAPDPGVKSERSFSLPFLSPQILKGFPEKA